MNKTSKDLQLQYEGFLKTPFLWHGKGVFNLHQFEIEDTKTSSFTNTIDKKLRLGKLVERFVSHQLHQEESITILAENIQIQNEKITEGELDCLLLQNNTPIHLEIIYKFYLYDESVGNSEIEHWIGPNRKDSLIQKITKLKEKQLPLLYSKNCVPYLQELNLDVKNIHQQVYFKAQLFVPYTSFGSNFPLLNNKTIIGFYITINQLHIFNDYKFYIPKKLNWLADVHTNVNWLSYNDFKTNIKVFIDEENAPLCWLKKQNGELFKFFIVWWN